MKIYKVGIVGASGYTGHELLKILKNHSRISLEVINSRSFSGQKVSSLYKDFSGSEAYTGLSYKEINAKKLDLIFLALPNGMSAEAVSQLDKQSKMIDLSADYRFKDPAVYEQVYGRKADYIENKWVFGLPELFKDNIKNAQLVANPGCYATASILAAYPVRNLAERIIFDCKSGWSGAGRDSTYAKNNSTIDNNLIAYNITKHRHKYEIEQFIKAKVSFTPHVLNTFQGLMCTAHVVLKDDVKGVNLTALYKDFYKDSPFVRIKGEIPKVSDTQKANFCDIGGFEIDEVNQLVIVSTIDNLWKGASGQAVQNMNLMLGFDENEGLL